MFSGRFFFIMKKQTLFLTLILAVLVTILAASGYATYKYLSNTPPQKEIKRAIDALATVKKAGANKFAVEKYLEAEKTFDQAMTEWKKQNEVFFLNRDYSEVRTLANYTEILCEESLSDGSLEKNSVNQQLKSKLAKLFHQIDHFEKYYKHLPLEKSTFQQFSKACLKCDEANDSYKDGQVYEAGKLADEAEILISKASTKGKEILVEFYKNYPSWEKNSKLAVELSSKGKTVLFVNKLESTCSVLKSGKIIKIFSAEFGQNWLGDKIRMGDKATPEGVYKVTKKKKGRETKFYKSLLLNYPNDEDKVRFDALIKNGEIPKNSRIGNLIEVHGHGGKGVNWTDGCIALSDNDMDVLFDLCSNSTTVIIVGSEKPFNSYFK